jgi:hypothetical protein
MILQGHKWKLECVSWNPTSNIKISKRYPSKGIYRKGKEDVSRNELAVGYR